jgi:hypothetical protein
VKFIIMQFSPQSIFLPFRSKYPPQHSVLKNPQSEFLPERETKFCFLSHHTQFTLRYQLSISHWMLEWPFVIRVDMKIGVSCSFDYISYLLIGKWTPRYKSMSSVLRRRVMW